MPVAPKQNPRKPRHAIGGRRRSSASGPPNSRLVPRVSHRSRRLDGALPVSLGVETLRLDQLCPTKMAIAIHRQLLPLMESDPAKFPVMTMCFRSLRADVHLRLCYGSETHVITMDQARDYLSRLIGGFKGRHTETDPKS